MKREVMMVSAGVVGGLVIADIATHGAVRDCVTDFVADKFSKTPVDEAVEAVDAFEAAIDEAL